MGSPTQFRAASCLGDAGIDRGNGGSLLVGTGDTEYGVELRCGSPSAPARAIANTE